jgi:hypothetical protein
MAGALLGPFMATGGTVPEVTLRMERAIAMHTVGPSDNGLPVPPPRSRVAMIDAPLELVGAAERSQAASVRRGSSSIETSRAKVPPGARRDQRVASVDHIGNVQPVDLGQQLVGVEPVEAEVLFQPSD